MYYKNISSSVKTFYGVAFNPGETKQVKGFINSPVMICVPEPKELPKQKKAPESAKKPVTSIESSKETEDKLNKEE